MAFNINEFRSQMQGDGARPNLFEVTLPFPAFSLPGTAQTKLSFMCKTAQLPGSTIGTVPVQYFGRELKFAGNRSFQDWSITIINDEDFVIRNAFERWMNGINSHVTNSGLANPRDYQADLMVEQLDKAGVTTKSYVIRGAFPTSVAAIELSYDTSDAIEEFTVEFQYQYWDSSTTT